MSAYQVLLYAMFIDAGPTRSAWVVIEVRSNGSIVPVQSGWHGMQDDAWLGGLMSWVWSKGGVVGLEYIDGGLYDRKRWRNLLETARVEGEIRRTARIRGAGDAHVPFEEMALRHKAEPRTLFCVPASSWRLDLCKRSGATDKEINVVVMYLCGRTIPGKEGPAVVLDIQGVTGESREHIVDAIGGALVLASHVLGIRLRIPDEVRGRQELARNSVLERRRAKKEVEKLQKMGVDPSRLKNADGTPFVVEKSRPARAVARGQRAKAANTRAHRARKP